MKEFGTVYIAELLRRLRSRPFILGLIIGTLGMLFLIKAPTMLNNAIAGPKSVVLVGDAELVERAAGLLGDEFTIAGRYENQPITPKLFADDQAASVIVLGAQKKHLTVDVYARDPASVNTRGLQTHLIPLQVQIMTGVSSDQASRSLEIPVQIHPVASKFANTGQAEAAHAIAYLLIFFLYLLILLNSQLVMSSVAEEKSSRIAELLIASVDPVVLLAGKIAAAGTLAIIQLFLWVGIAVFAGFSGASVGHAPMNVPSGSIASFDLGGISVGVLATFIAFFVLGLLQVSTLFAGLASLVNRTEDLGSLQGPFVIPVVGALFIAMNALGSPDTLVSVVASFVPILSPFVMFARMAVSNVPIAQVAIALLLNLAALGAIAIAAGKLYRVGLLLYGRPPRISQVWNVLRT